jgi:hypothetical protein
MLNNALWKDIYLGKNVDELYQLFINKFLYYFTRAFPLKLVNKRNKRKILWISRGIKVSCQKMRLLNNLK